MGSAYSSRTTAQHTPIVDDSYAQGAAHGYITFAADDRELRSIPEYPAEPYNSHSDGVTTLSAASNFLYLLNPESFSSRSVFLATLDATEYDVFIIDLFFSDNTSLTAAEVAELQTKPNGRRRLVVCYMSIGEAEDYRYYWQPAWTTSPPDWMVEENPDWPGNFKVEYWDPAWQADHLRQPKRLPETVSSTPASTAYTSTSSTPSSTSRTETANAARAVPRLLPRRLKICKPFGRNALAKQKELPIRVP